MNKRSALVTAATTFAVASFTAAARAEADCAACRD